MPGFQRIDGTGYAIETSTDAKLWEEVTGDGLDNLPVGTTSASVPRPDDEPGVFLVRVRGGL